MKHPARAGAAAPLRVQIRSEPGYSAPLPIVADKAPI